MSTPSPAADHNLIFGLLALQMDFITREQLLDAMHAWMLAKHTPLGEILCRQGVLDEDDRADLDRLVHKHVKRHGNPQASLAALHVERSVHQQLHGLDDADVQSGLASLASTLPDSRTPAACVPTAGSTLSVRFRRLREHARGGLGEVFVALDEELHREVALKEIQPCFADHPDSRARFLREAEVTGNLEHPGVVPVYGMGVYPDGRPYYAMRFIRGESMQEAIGRFHKADDDPGRDAGERSLALRDLLSRFVVVRNAIDYAHSRGVVHRDIKPANVMLGEYGETLVVDWGLARMLDQDKGEQTTAERPVLLGTGSGSAATEMGQVLGTPAYMPPEQALGQLDLLNPRSDVFALGATLYALLTGQAPYRGPDALAQAHRAEVAPARQSNPSVPAALEAVCGKALAARPEERYATARALAEEVQRWLADEPVAAYREPWLARLGRWAQRHRSSVMSAAAALAVLTMSLGILAAVLTSHNRALAEARDQEREARDQEREAKDREREAKDRARANFRLARQAVKQYCVKISLNRRLQQADLNDLRKELLQTAVQFHEKFKAQESDDPEVQAERAEAYFELGFIANLIGSTREAVGHYRQALDLWTTLVAAHPDNRAYRWGLASCYNDVAHLYGDIGRAADAENAYRKSLALNQELAEAPGDNERQDMLARSHNNLALWLAGRNRFQEAEEHYGKALKIRQALVNANRGNADYLRELADTRHKLGYLYFWTNRRQQAGEAYQQALAIRQKLHQAHPHVLRYQEDLAFSHVNLGQWYRTAGKPKEAEKSLRKAVQAFQSLAEARPSVPDYQSHLAYTLKNLGLFYQANRQTQQALKFYRQSLEIEERLSKRYPANVGYAVGLGGSYCNMGRRLTQNDDPKAALEWFDKAQTRLEDARKRDASNVLARTFLRNTHWNRAEALLELDRLTEALREWDRALELDSNDKDRAYSRLGRAVALVRMGKYDQAVSLAEEQVGKPEADTYALYRGARVLSLASGKASQDAKRGPTQRQKLAEQYAARAVALLRRAQAQGYFKEPSTLADLQKDRDLEPLRLHPDFQRLLHELQKKP